MLTRLLIGEIVNVHGVRGALKVRPLTDHPARFSKLDEVDVIMPGNASKKAPDGRMIESGKYKVLSASVSGEFVLLKLGGIYDRDTADLLRGAQLEIPREKAITLPKDSYFIGDLIGCSVYDTDSGELLGTVSDVFQTGSNDVYAITMPDKKEIMIPAIAQVVKEVDIEKGTVKVHLLPGLKEVYLNNDED